MGLYHYPAPPPFMGGGQPHAPRELPASLLAVAVTNPPFTDGGPIPLPASIIAMAQPNPWVYAFFGGRQPYDPASLTPSIIAVQVDNPPFTDGGPSVIPASIVSIAQPDPWTYTFLGGRQPYEPKKLSPAIPGQSIDPPPFVHKGRSPTIAQLGQVQPDPWQYLFMGAAQPYAPRLLNPAIPGRSVDPPPFTLGGPLALKHEGVAVNQPGWSYTAWPYVFMGGRQPYQARAVPPATAAVVVNNPPFGHPSRSAAMRAIRDAWNPPPFDFQMTLYASRVGPPKLGRPTARGYFIY